MSSQSRALRYHSVGRKGKLEVIPTKPLLTQNDLSLAYTPGVAEPCRSIAKNPMMAYEYTAKGNLVAVVSNGTAVLGTGKYRSIGRKTSYGRKGKPLQKFADIDVFDIELDAETPEEVIAAVKAIAPTFGGINLEDIRAPDCFEIERKLEELLNIPVFHDDQHGTAIIAGAAITNALEITNRKFEDIKVVFTGAGAASSGNSLHACRTWSKRERISGCLICMVWFIKDVKKICFRKRTSLLNQQNMQSMQRVKRAHMPMLYKVPMYLLDCPLEVL